MRAAEAVLRGAVKAGADSARQELALLLLATCRPEEAEKLLAKARDKDAETWRILAQIRARLRRPGPARQAMASAIAAGRGPIEGLFDLAMWLWKEEEVEPALASLNEAIQRAPSVAALIWPEGRDGAEPGSAGRGEGRSAAGN